MMMMSSYSKRILVSRWLMQAKRIPEERQGGLYLRDSFI